MGTLLISKIREEYPDRMMLTFSVVPSPKVMTGSCLPAEQRRRKIVVLGGMSLSARQHSCAEHLLTSSDSLLSSMI